MNQDPINPTQHQNYMSTREDPENDHQVQEQSKVNENDIDDNEIITVEASQDINQMLYNREIKQQQIYTTIQNQQKQKNKPTIQNCQPTFLQQEEKKQQNIKQEILTKTQIISDQVTSPFKQAATASSIIPQKPAITINVFQQKINSACQLKKIGNQYFKGKDYVGASQKYQEALKVLDPNQFYGATHQECVKMAEVSSQLLNNIGTCFFNSMDWKRAEIYYTEAITINPKYTKALLKRALSRYQLQKHFQALEDIKLAYQQDKSSQQIHAAYEKILAAYKIAASQEKAKAKELSSKMFKSQVEQKKQIVNNKQQQQKQQQKQKQKDGFNWSWVTVAATVGLIGYQCYKAFSK